MRNGSGVSSQPAHSSACRRRRQGHRRGTGPVVLISDEPEPSEADQLRELGRGLEKGTALGAQSPDQLGWLSRNLKAGPARPALVVGHNAPFHSLIVNYT